MSRVLRQDTHATQANIILFFSEDIFAVCVVVVMSCVKTIKKT